MRILIFPVTLFSFRIYQYIVNEDSVFVYVEHPKFFTQYKYHMKKLLLHRASMKCHQKQCPYKTEYYEYKQYKKAIGTHCFSPNDKELEEEYKNLIMWESPMFLLHKEVKEMNHSTFYKFMRRKFDILMKKNKPLYGQWSFDKENRKVLPISIKIPSLPTLSRNRIFQQSIIYVKKHFHTYGTTDDFVYPYTRKQAKKFLSSFVRKRLKHFGAYQDYIEPGEAFLFHSVLSSSLNIGLLTPHEVIDKVIQQKVPYASKEGFIRQILSWREYVRNIYLKKHGTIPNYFRNKKKLNHTFYEGTTCISILDHEIHKLLQYAYSHHIVRLMVFGNLFTLLEIHPKEIYKWFMELFIDAYDWVMWANIYGMGTYADGGYTMTKPYLASSNYLKKMSRYELKDSPYIDGLYWQFIKKHKKKLKKMYATSRQVALYEKMNSSTKKQHKQYKKKILALIQR